MALGVGVWWVAPWSTATTVTLAGSAYTNGSQTAIGFTPADRLEAARHGVSTGHGFSMAGVLWAGPDDVWHESDGPVGCLEPNAPTDIELTFVRVRAGNDALTPTHAVTSVRCLDRP